MTDFHIEAPIPRSRTAPPRAEYMTYFVLIFLATLPLSTLTWALTAARTLSVPDRGPVARALSQTHIITPQIFRG